MPRRPAPTLRPLVDAYIGYRVSGPRGLHRGLPSRHLTLIASIGEPIDVVTQTDPRQRPDRYRFVVGGLQAGPALIATPELQEGVAIELTPRGSRALLRMPAAALWDRVVEAGDVMGSTADELWERLHLAADWPSRFAACDDVFCRLVSLGHASAPAQEARAWELLAASGGTLGVAEVADRVGWSRRHLAARFRAELGLAPKAYARVLRFERVVAAVRAAGAPRLAEVAADAGYADQPHLTREVRALAGMTPGQLLRREFPDVQDAAAGAA